MFTVCTPDTYKTIISEYVRQLGEKVAFLMVDYRLAPQDRFPDGLQDVLDAYLWLTNSSSATLDKALGFKVGKVLIAGDSAGSCLAASMLLSLSDAQKMWPKKDFPLPQGFLSIVGAFTLKIESYPSSLMGSLDFGFGPYQKALVWFGAYSPFKPQRETFATEKELRECPTLNDFTRIARHPYMSPLYFEDFKSLKDIPISLITTTACFMSDNSVLFAKKWAGPVELTVLERQPHGFFIYGEESARAAVETCANEFKRLLGL